MGVRKALRIEKGDVEDNLQMIYTKLISSTSAAPCFSKYPLLYFHNIPFNFICTPLHPRFPGIS